MRVMVCLDNGRLAHEQEVGPGQAFVLHVEPSNIKGVAQLIVDGDRVQVDVAPADRLDLGDRLLLGWCVAYQFVFMVLAASFATSFGASAILLAAAFGWGWLLRKAWRATA